MQDKNEGDTGRDEENMHMEEIDLQMDRMIVCRRGGYTRGEDEEDMQEEGMRKKCRREE